jgi:hypothetical protein
MLLASILLSPWDKIIDAAAKFVDASGKGPLAFVTSLVLILAALAYKFFGKEATWVRIGAWLIIIACMFSFVLLLVIPSSGVANVEPSKANPKPGTVVLTPKQCTGAKTLVFTPDTPGVMQMVNGHRVDLGDGGGGTRLEQWKYSWQAPAGVTTVQCAGQRNEHVLAENRNGSVAECIGSINGGNDAMTMQVKWDGPCDQQ